MMTNFMCEHENQRTDVPISYGITDVKMELQSLNSVEVTWNAECDAGVFIKVNCISTEFTARKHGGEKGAPFRVQLETYTSASDTISSDVTEKRLLHCASCQIKVFKVYQITTFLFDNCSSTITYQRNKCQF